MKSYGPSYLAIIFFIYHWATKNLDDTVLKILEKSVRLKKVRFILFSMIHLKERT